MESHFTSARAALIALDSLPTAVENLAHSPSPADVEAIVNQTEAALETLKQHHGEQSAGSGPERSNGHTR